MAATTDQSTEPQTYDAISRFNHWIIALAMIGMLAFGFFLEYGWLAREAKGPLIGIHKAIGVLVLIFGAWRVGYRLFQGFPDSVANMPAWQEITAKVAHWGLLAGILVMPASGIVSSIFRGRAVEVFGLFTIPAQGEVTWLANLAAGTHGWAGIAVAVLLVLHVAGALKHHFIDRDATLARMVSGRTRAV